MRGTKKIPGGSKDPRPQSDAGGASKARSSFEEENSNVKEREDIERDLVFTPKGGGVMRSPTGDFSMKVRGEKCGRGRMEDEGETTDTGTSADEGRKRKKQMSPGDSEREKVAKKKREKGEALEDTEGRSEEEAVEEKMVSPSKNIWGTISNIERWMRLGSAKGKIKKEYSDNHERDIERLKEQVRRLERENAELIGRMKERNEIVELMCGTRRILEDEREDKGRQTFAEIVSGNDRKESSVTRRKKKQEVIITKEGMDPEEVRKELMKEEGVKVNVRKMVKTRQGVLVEVEKKEEIEALKGSMNLKERGYVIKEGKKIKPMMILYDVDGGRDETENLKELYERNVRIHGVEEQEFLRSVKIRRKVKHEGRGGKGGVKEKRENWVFETSGKIFKILEQKERVFLRWEASRIRQYIDVVRCYKCQGYGHIGRVCTAKTACGKCGGAHDTRECRGNPENIKCANCEREGRDSRHSVKWQGCDVLKRNEERYLSMLDIEN